MVIMRTRVLTLALCCFSPALATASPLVDYDVLTTNGKITGHPAPNVRNTAEFLGIPTRSHLLDNFASHRRYRLIAMDRLLLRTGYVSFQCSIARTPTDGDQQGEYVKSSKSDLCFLG